MSPRCPSHSVLPAHHAEQVFNLTWQLTGTVLLCEKRQKRKEARLAKLEGGGEGCGKGVSCCQSVCLPRPCPLPPRAACPPAAVISWLSSGKETAKQGTVYLCRLYSLHIPAAGLRHHSNLPGSAKKRPADLLSTTVCIEVPWVRINRRQCPSSVQQCRPDNPTSPPEPPPNSPLIQIQWTI